MKDIITFIYEQLSVNESHFSIDYWSYDDFRYPKLVIDHILKGGDLTIEGTDIEISADDFNTDELQSIRNNLGEANDAEMVRKFNSTYNGDQRYRKTLWTHIEKKPFSGGKGKGGFEFEDVISENIQILVLYNELPKDVKHRDVTLNLWDKIKSHNTITKLRSMNLDLDSVKDYVFVSGKGKTARNGIGQILDKDTFEVNTTKKISKSEEEQIENVLTQSGKIIADVTITLDGKKFNKSDIWNINKDDIYISCKDGVSQFSGISMQQPFYGDNPKTKGGDSWIIDCYRDKKSYDEFIKNTDNICVKAFDNLCDLLGIEPKEMYDYFSQPVSERKNNVQIKTNKIPKENDDKFACLIQLLIGGNYWYVNSNGTVAWIDDDIEHNKFTFIPSGTGHFEPKQAVVTGTMKLKGENETKCELKFRNSQHGDYPFRLMIVPTNHHVIKELFG